MSKLIEFGFDAVINTLVEAEQNKNKSIEKSLNRMANEVLSVVPKRTPVDSGDLRKGWFANDPVVSGSNSYIEVSNIMEYAAPVEFGVSSKNRKGVFMLTKSLEDLNDIQKDLEKEIMTEIIGKEWKKW